jgi:hypothetical protein
MTTIGDAPVFENCAPMRNNTLAEEGSGQCGTALHFDPEPMHRSPAGMMAAKAGGRPITHGRSDLRRRATLDPYAVSYVSSVRAMPNSST